MKLRRLAGIVCFIGYLSFRIDQILKHSNERQCNYDHATREGSMNPCKVGPHSECTSKTYLQSLPSTTINL